MQEDIAETEVTGHNELKKNVLGLPSALAMSLAFISPTIGVIFISAFIAGKAGVSSPFVFLLGTVGISLMALTLAQFTRRITSAGTFYKFITNSFGVGTGFVAALVLLFSYTLQSPLNADLFGGFVSNMLKADLGINVSWFVLVVFIVVAVGALSWYSVHTSMKFDIAFVIAEVTIVGTLLLLIVFKGGAAGQVPTSFLPTHGASGFGGLGEAFVFIVLAFFGFESCSTVAEECRNPRRNLPRALVGSVVLTGLWFSFAMYAIIVGYGSKNVGLISKAVSPLHDLAVQYIGSWYGTVIDLAAVSAMIAVLLAIHTANFRIIYSLGRDGMLPKSLGRTHPKWKTPHIAIIVFSIFSLIVATIAGAAWGPVGAFGDLGYLSSLGILPIYIGANVALPYFMKRHFKSEFSFFLHVILPAISSLIFLVAIYLSLHPWPASPETFFPWILLLWILGAIAWAVYLKKKDSSMLTRLGMVMFMVPESGFAEPDMLEIVVSAGDEVGHS